MTIVWIAILSAVHVFGVWQYFVWLYLVPAAMAANLQSWKKYIKHVGLTGSTVRSATRSIVAEDAIGKIVAFTLLHESYHGVHHLRAGCRAKLRLRQMPVMLHDEVAKHSRSCFRGCGECASGRVASFLRLHHAACSELCHQALENGAHDRCDAERLGGEALRFDTELPDTLCDLRGGEFVFVSHHLFEH